MVAYASDRAGESNLDLYVQQVSGGRSVRLTDHPADDHDPNFSPDGSQIVFRSERDGGAVYVVPVLGGEARLIAPKGSKPRFSPDGKTIAFQLGTFNSDSAIFLAPASGGKATKLQTNILWAGYPTWSPDGSRILFLGSETARRPDSFYTAPANGGTARKTLPLASPFGTQDIQWLAGGKLLYSIRNYLGGGGSLWTVRISSDGTALSSPERFTLGAGNEGYPSADSGGSRIVFAGLQVGQDIWTIPARGNEGKTLGEMRRITQGPADSTYPTVSRDGKRLVYTSDRSGNWDLYLRDLETGKERALTSAPIIAARAEISPDGSRAAFTGAGPVSVVSTRGGVPEKICEQCALTVLGWTADSQRLITGRGKPISLILLDAKTGKPSPLLSHPEWDLVRGQISPDGHWVAFTLRTDATRSGTSISPFRNGTGADQKEWITITDGEGADVSPTWSPDGNLLYFVTGRKEFQDLWAIRLNPETKHPAGEPFEVLSFHSARRPLVSSFGKAVTKDALFWAMQEFTGNIWVAERTP
jgi:Tol biopolymer transport system component